ncbi:MAG: ribonuclease PH [Lentisphaeria bacterium]|nr:ribonuclease PH [Lentisphaeria bacterium]
MARQDGRMNDELRNITLTKNFLTHPAGSVLIDQGGTRVICAVSLEQGVPPWMRAQNVPGGWVTCEYGLLPASTHQRCQREASKGKQGGRTMEIQRLIGRSFRSVIDLSKLGANTLHIDCDVIDANGGTRCASITGTSVALVLALRKMVAQGILPEIPMRENVAAVSVGILKNECILDLCYEEDSAAEVDMNIVMTESGKFVEIQGTAEEQPFSHDDLEKLLSYAKKGLDKIFALQREVLAQ